MSMILVIKTLTISKIAHLFVALPDPREQFMNELEALFLQILWDGKKSKIILKICHL